jgi:hypothetical protein
LISKINTLSLTSFPVTGLEGSRDNPVLLDFEDIPGSEGEEEISTFQQNFDAPKNPISIGDDAIVYESPESQREGSTVVGCLHGSPVGLIRVPEENVENPKSHGEYGLGTKCPQPQTEDTHTTAIGFSEPPIYYFDESRLYESPKSDWQGSTSVDLYTASQLIPFVFLTRMWRIQARKRPWHCHGECSDRT